MTKSTLCKEIFYKMPNHLWKQGTWAHRRRKPRVETGQMTISWKLNGLLGKLETLFTRLPNLWDSESAPRNLLIPNKTRRWWLLIAILSWGHRVTRIKRLKSQLCRETLVNCLITHFCAAWHKRKLKDQRGLLGRLSSCRKWNRGTMIICLLNGTSKPPSSENVLFPNSSRIERQGPQYSRNFKRVPNPQEARIQDSQPIRWNKLLKINVSYSDITQF